MARTLDDHPRSALIRSFVAGTLSITTAFGIAYGASAFSPSFITYLGAGPIELALLTALVTATYFWLGSTATRVGYRYGARTLLLVAAVTVAAGLCGAALAQSMLWVFATFTVGLGVTVACAYVPLVGLVGQRWEAHPHRSWALGAATAGVSVGSSVAGPVLLALVGWFGWRPALVSAGLGCAVLFVIAALAAGPPIGGPVPPRAAPLARLMRDDRVFRGLYVSLVLLALPRFMPFAFLIPYAHQNGIQGVAAGLLLTAVGLGGLVSRAAVGLATRRVIPLALYRVSAAVLTASYAIWWVAPAEFGWLALFGVLMGGSYGAIIAVCPEIAMRFHGGEGFAGVLARLYTANGVGALICLVGAGVIAHYTGGYSAAIVAGGVLAAGAGLATAGLRPPANPR